MTFEWAAKWGVLDPTELALGVVVGLAEQIVAYSSDQGANQGLVWGDQPVVIAEKLAA